MFTTPAVVVNMNMEPVWFNGSGALLLEKQEDFLVIENRVVCAAAAQRNSFKSFVAGVKDKPEVWVYDRSPDLPVLVRGDRLTPKGAAPGIALMFHSTHSGEGYLWADLGKVFGLTPSEQHIVKRVVGGDRASGVARDLGITLETVRTHIRRVYGKLNVSSREELFSLINPYRVR